MAKNSKNVYITLLITPRDQSWLQLLIEECTAMLLAGRVAEQELASVLYQTYAAKSAIFLDEYQVSARV